MSAYCVLSYPTLDDWLDQLRPDDSLRAALVRAAEATSSALTIIVRTTASSDAPPNPWEDAPSSGSSSSSAAAAASTRDPPAAPTRLFLRLERALAALYSIATDSFVQRNLVLARVDVVVEQLRTQPVCLPSPDRATVVRWNAPPQHPHHHHNVKSRHASEAAEAAHAAVTVKRLYPVVALGGTFDHLHSGHKILLTMAASITSRKLIVGVTDDALLGTKKFRHLLEPLKLRIRNVHDFVALIRPQVKCACVPLQ
ncbi:hypothetical protein JCM3774_005445, partial [Rhodotorula dairenensis]